MLKFKQVKPNVYKVSASTQQELGSTFVRFQEYYESPKFRKKIFTLGQFKHWYTQTNGSYSYCEDWCGFNIPSTALEPFRQGLFDPLTEQEEWLLYKIKNKKEDFYLIGSNDDKLTLRHELCHALFFINKNYRSQVQDLLYKHKAELEHVFNFIEQLGYHKSVLEDEVNSYITTSYRYLQQFDIKVDKQLRNKFKNLHKKFQSCWK